VTEWLSRASDEQNTVEGEEIDGTMLRMMRREAKRENETQGEW
jgi:hypothetical protein